MSLRRRLAFGLGGLALMVTLATAGYVHLMGWSPAQAFYFTIITITTIGYSDYNLSPEAKVFTVGLVVVGIGFWTLSLASLAESWALSFEGRRRRRMERELSDLCRHFIVVGHGVVGREVVKWLRQGGRTVLVVDVDPAVVEAVHEAGIPALQGDATEEETLTRAGIQRAAGLLAVTRNDPVNVFVTLTARSMCPELYIAANAIAPGVERKLQRAGATVVVSPYEIGAQRLAMAAVSPHVASMFAGFGEEDQQRLVLREAEVEAESPVCGKRLRDSQLREQTGVLLAAIKAAGGGDLAGSPTADTVLSAGDILIGFGLVANMPKFVELVSPAAARELNCLSQERRRP